MALKDRIRRAVGRSDSNDRSSISSSSTGGKRTGTTTPTSGTSEFISPLTTIKTAVEPSKPNITLTKTHSRLGKTLTWHSSNPDKKSKKEAAKDKQLKRWEKEDEVEWTTPMSKRPAGRKDMGCQNTLRAFDFRQAVVGSGDRNRSICSGVSPSGSRVNSIDEGSAPIAFNTKRHSSGAVGPGKLSQELKRDDKETIIDTSKPQMAEVREE